MGSALNSNIVRLRQSQCSAGFLAIHANSPKCQVIQVTQLLSGRTLSDLVLDGKNIGKVAVITVGPQMAAARPFYQLGCNPHPVPGLADAALDQVGDPQVS